MDYYSQQEIINFRKLYTEIDNPRVPYRDFSFYQGKKILLWTRKPGLGDMIMNCISCDILRDLGLDVYYGCRFNPCDRDFPNLINIPWYKYQPDIKKLPLEDNKIPRGYSGGIDFQGETHPFDFIIDFRYSIGLKQNTIFQCLKEFGVKKLENCKGFRIKDELPKPEKVYDVIMSCSTGGWKPVRAYSKHKELEVRLNQRGLSVLNLTDDNKGKLGLTGLLSLVKHSKCFIGTETGPTHAVSGVSPKSIIIQAGIHSSAFWNVYPNTFVVEPKLDCGGRQCKVRKHEECTEMKDSCINHIDIEEILKYV